MTRHVPAASLASIISSTSFNSRLFNLLILYSHQRTFQVTRSHGKNQRQNLFTIYVTNVLMTEARPEQTGHSTTGLIGAYTSWPTFHKISVAVLMWASPTCWNLGILSGISVKMVPICLVCRIVSLAEWYVMVAMATSHSCRVVQNRDSKSPKIIGGP